MNYVSGFDPRATAVRKCSSVPNIVNTLINTLKMEMEGALGRGGNFPGVGWGGERGGGGGRRGRGEEEKFA